VTAEYGRVLGVRWPFEAAVARLEDCDGLSESWSRRDGAFSACQPAAANVGLMSNAPMTASRLMLATVAARRACSLVFRRPR
jgi:hypothetical protein